MLLGNAKRPFNVKTHLNLCQYLMALIVNPGNPKINEKERKNNTAITHQIYLLATTPGCAI
jgi:hypothetical protein